MDSEAECLPLLEERYWQKEEQKEEAN